MATGIVWKYKMALKLLFVNQFPMNMTSVAYPVDELQSEWFKELRPMMIQWRRLSTQKVRN